MPIVTSRFVDKAWQRGCDCITLDLEDSVPGHLKEQARALVKEAIPNVAKGGAYVFVRINKDSTAADLNESIWPGLLKVRYPKTEHPDEIRAIDEIITRLELERGIPPGTIEINAHMETALGVANAYEIASASPRIKEFGGSTGYDMSRDLGMEMFVEFDQFIYTKGEVELAARALGLGLVRTNPFIANTSGSVSNSERALQEAIAARRCGFRGSGGALNPALVESHNRGYTPSDEDIADARWVLEQYRRLEGGEDTWIDVDNRIIDRYEAARAQDTLDWAALCKDRDREKQAAMARVEAAMAQRPGKAS